MEIFDFIFPYGLI